VLGKLSPDHLPVRRLSVIRPTITIHMREIGKQIDNMIEATHPDLAPRLHDVEEEDHTGTEIVRAIDLQAIVQAEAGAEALEKNDHDDILHHRTGKS
jgi:hypothetical protein